MAQVTHLPPELIVQITSYLRLAETAQLSIACKALRAQLVPHIFATIRFSNREKNADAALAAMNIYGSYTTHIEFIGRGACDDQFTEPALPPAAKQLLNGHGMPNLRSAAIKFKFDFYEGEDWTDYSEFGGSIYVFNDPEDSEAVDRAEKKHQWRALMNEVWRAVACNASVTELIVDRFIPKWTSAFRTDAFHGFLSRLETASFHILGGNNGAGWDIITADHYGEVVGQLDDMFLRHMHNLTSLSLRGSSSGALGHFPYDNFSVPLPLRPGCMARLQFLKLENCYAGEELLCFLADHKDELRSIDLTKCFGRDVAALTEYELEEPHNVAVECWADFLEGVRELEPSKLTDFVAGGPWREDDFESLVDEDESEQHASSYVEEAEGDEDGVEDEDGEGEGDEEGAEEGDESGDEDGDEEEEEEGDEATGLDVVTDEEAELETFVKANPSIRVFRYCDIDDKYGSLYTDAGSTVVRVKAGHDELAFTKLMDWVRKNRVRVSNEHLCSSMTTVYP